jgi:hypothetical protein
MGVFTVKIAPDATCDVQKLSATADNTLTNNNRAGKGGPTPQKIHSRTKCRPIQSRWHAFSDIYEMPEPCEPGFTTQDEFEMLVSASSFLCPPVPLFGRLIGVMSRLFALVHVSIFKRRNTHTHTHTHTHKKKAHTNVRKTPNK